METITSLTNSRVKFWNSLREKKQRDLYGLFVVEEEHLIEEALSSGLLDTLIVRQDVKEYPSFENTVAVSEAVMKKISSTVSLNRICGIVKKPSGEKAGRRVILLDEVQDPGNVGTIIRTAYSFGFDSVVLSKGCADAYNSKTIRSSQGALFHLNVINADLPETIRELKEKGIPVYGTALKGAVDLETVKPSEECALVFGNEGAGVSEEVLALCDTIIKIRMTNFESLNVAVSAGILAYFFRL